MATFQPSLIETLEKSSSNRVERGDSAFHTWYRFVLSFPPHLVRQYLHEFDLNENDLILDPFAGTGTTLVEAKLNHVNSIGIEANPLAHFASQVKLDWAVDVKKMVHTAEIIAKNTGLEIKKRAKGELLGFDLEQSKLVIKDSISPVPLHKTLLLKQQISTHYKKRFFKHLQLALAKSTVLSASNLRFGPEIGVGKIKEDCEVISLWLDEVRTMAKDIEEKGRSLATGVSILADSRDTNALLRRNSIDAVFTSPPYPNEKDYSRTTRLESVLLDFLKTKDDLRAIKKTLLRSNTRNIYKNDNDYKWAENLPEVEVLANEIEERRISLGKTSGFERLYSTVTREYFGGMARHLAQLRGALKSGAKLAYVVGDQASYLRVMIRTGQIIAKIADGLGYKVERIDLFRERFATSTKQQLREEVVVLKWEGGKNE